VTAQSTWKKSTTNMRPDAVAELEQLALDSTVAPRSGSPRNRATSAAMVASIGERQDRFG
jgi:hypothetical protein